MKMSKTKSNMPRETKQQRAQRIHEEYAILCEEIPNPQPGLVFRNSFELLIATMMSAQTTDVRVNSVTPELFALYPTADTSDDEKNSSSASSRNGVITCGASTSPRQDR